MSCELIGKTSRWSDPVPCAVSALFGTCDCCSMDDLWNGLISHAKATIGGKEFTAGQRIRGRRCGSVITCVVGGQSYYGRVIRFFSSPCEYSLAMFAYVSWLGLPEYPFEGTPLVVKVRDDSVACPAPPIVSILDIDPSRVACERCEKESAFYMYRLEGLDTIKNT